MIRKKPSKFALLILSAIATLSNYSQAQNLVTQPLTQIEFQKILTASETPYKGAIPIFDNDNIIHYAFHNNEHNIPYLEDITFKLHSKPWAKQTIYLDIHDYFYERLKTPFSFYDVDNSGGLSRAERRNLQAHYLSVVEAFSAFDIDVTTEDPGLDALLRTSIDDEYFGSRIILSDANPPDGVLDISASGSPIYEIPTLDEPERPTFVYEIRSFSYHGGSGTNHEFGHTLGAVHIEPSMVGDRPVKHATGKGETWWTGHMGTSQSGLVGHWLLADLSSFQNHEVIVTPDDHSDERINATPMQATNIGSHTLSHHGLIGDNQDIDVFSFTLAHDQYIEVYADTPRYVPKIDIELTLYDHAGKIMQQHNAISHLDSVVFDNLIAGDYFISVKGEGHPQSERHNGYFDFGSTGHYTLFLTQRDYLTGSLVVENDRYTVLEDSSITVAPLENDTVSADATITWLGHTAAGNDRSINKNNQSQIAYSYHSQRYSNIFAAEDEILYRVEDNGQSAMGRIIMDVQSVADNSESHFLAQINDDLIRVLPNQSNIIDPVYNDAPLKDYGIDHSALTQPQNGQVTILQNGQFEYTPITDFSGTDQFSYGLFMPGRSYDIYTGITKIETLTYRATVTLQVSQGELVAADDIRYTNEDIAVDVRVLDNDFSQQGALTIIAFTQPNHGTVTSNIDNTLSYNPDQDFHGDDTFTYTVSDGSSSLVANVQIVLVSANDNPVAVADHYTIPANKSFNFNVMSNDHDSKDNASSFTVYSNNSTQHGTLTKKNSQGSFTYKPNAFFCGEDSFLYIIRDNQRGRSFTEAKIIVEGDESSCASADDTIIKASFSNIPTHFDFNQNPSFDITFSTDITGFGYSDLQLSHGIIESFEMIENNIVRVILKVTSQQDLILQLKDNAVQNDAGLNNQASAIFTLTYADVIKPDVTIITPESYNEGEDVIFVFKFTEPVINFTEQSLDYTVQNNNRNGFIRIAPQAEDFEKIDESTYSIRMPTSGSHIRMLVKSNSFEDLAGNKQTYRFAKVNRAASSLAAKLVSIEPAQGQNKNSPQQTFIVRFNKPVDGLTAQDFVLSNSDKQTYISHVSSRSSGQIYQVNVEIADNSDEEIKLSLTGLFSGQGVITGQLVDRKAPVFSLNQTKFSTLAPIQVTLQISERALDINENAISVSNAKITAFKLGDDSQSLLLTLLPESLDDVVITLSDVVTNDLAGNENIPFSSIITFDAPVPTIYTINALITNGSATPATQTIISGESATIVFDLEAGYQLDSISSAQCTGQLNEHTFTITAVTQNCTVTAVTIEIPTKPNIPLEPTINQPDSSVSSGGDSSILLLLLSLFGIVFMRKTTI